MLLPIVLLLLAGAAAGFLSGLLGIGGGLLVVAALSIALPALGVPKAEVMHVSVATSMATIVLTFVSSGAAHIRRGSVLWPTWRWLAPGMALGGIAGAHMAQMLSGQTLRWVIAAFCAFMAWRMVYGKTPARNAGKAEHAPRSPWLLPAGAGIGAISAVAGIGGGSMTVPLLVWLGVRPVRAVGTSAVCGLAIALASASSYALALHPLPQPLPWGAVGYLYVPAAAIVTLASIALAPVGARIAHGISGVAIKRAFAVLLIAVGAVIAAGG
jgi:uncharacterized membrane protein YfcA